MKHGASCDLTYAHGRIRRYHSSVLLSFGHCTQVIHQDVKAKILFNFRHIYLYKSKFRQVIGFNFLSII
jgi:hypothetical protein